MNRRDFVKLSALTAAGFALVGKEVFAAVDPLPINEGPGPLWENFQYVVHGPEWSWTDPLLNKKYRPRKDGKWTAGWKGYLTMPDQERQMYGDYVVVSDIFDEDILHECKTLLKEQADDVRHQLILDAKIPCFCRMCKVTAICKATLEQRGSRAFCSYTFNGVPALTCSDQGLDRADLLMRQDILAMQGPTHGYV